jgi:hypothetical protein
MQEKLGPTFIAFVEMFVSLWSLFQRKLVCELKTGIRIGL